ncbi:MAG: response regulator [Planctomycetota bacterium]|nr:response regulator [Planctomycetota bacterium]
MSSRKPRILLIADAEGRDAELYQFLRDNYEVVEAEGHLRALAYLQRESFDGVYVMSSHVGELIQVGRQAQKKRILECMPDGVVLLDSENKIVWHNDRMCDWCPDEKLLGKNFYNVLSSPEILGPDFCPFHTAMSSDCASSSTLRTGENLYFQIHAAPVYENGGPPNHLIVTIRDVTEDRLQQQKLAAIHKAGMELADLKPEELMNMSVEERIELLKSNILHYTGELLHYDVVEIRLLDKLTNKLDQLVAVGIDAEAAQRELFALPQNNGVTGFVAATGKSYLCENTVEDPLYVAGAEGANSSLTVPLILHDEVIGTFNVESPEPRAFNESDLQFLEIFGRDVARALGTLELLVAEKASTAAESVEAIHTAVALPIDDILNEAVNVMERYIGHEPEVIQRLEKILRAARDIKQVIQKVGQTMTPSEAVPQALQAEPRPLLVGRRVLVADDDESVRSAAHALLERYHCTVETAHDGAETLYMVRNTSALGGYDVVIADIRLPDMNGYELMRKLSELHDAPTLVLMTGFGYDPGHSIVKARQAGLAEVLYKPFRLDQLLETVERIVSSNPAVTQS